MRRLQAAPAASGQAVAGAGAGPLALTGRAQGTLAASRGPHAG